MLNKGATVAGRKRCWPGLCGLGYPCGPLGV